MGKEAVLFDDLVDLAAEHLPKGWELQLVIEQGYGGFHLYDPAGNDSDLPLAGNEFNLEYELQVCVDFARVSEGMKPHFDENFDISDWE